LSNKKTPLSDTVDLNGNNLSDSNFTILFDLLDGSSSVSDIYTLFTNVGNAGSLNLSSFTVSQSSGTAIAGTPTIYVSGSDLLITDVQAVILPEPSTFFLFGVGALFLAAVKNRLLSH
jgi:hypothetical protein